MKLCSGLLLLCCIAIVCAQCPTGVCPTNQIVGSFRGINGKLLGDYQSSGQVTLTDQNGNVFHVATFEANGDVRNNAGKKVGKIEPDGTIRGLDGAVVGSFVAPFVRGKYGEKIGTVQGGEVRDESGRKIGTYNGVPAIDAAVFFFFLSPSGSQFTLNNDKLF